MQQALLASTVKISQISGDRSNDTRFSSFNPDVYEQALTQFLN